MRDKSISLWSVYQAWHWPDSLKPHLSTTSMRFTQHKTAIITIKNFRLIFTRIPLGTLGTLTSHPSLAIECLWFSVLGSSGEAIFGNPKSITDHPDLRLWADCLKRDGGAGCVLLHFAETCVERLLIIGRNILKDRKMRQQLTELAGVTPSPMVLHERHQL